MIVTSEQMEKQYKEFLLILKRGNQEMDFEKIDKAWEFSKKKHADQKRFTGDPYASHTLEVARTLATWEMDTSSIVAGFLHDTVEDANVSIEEISKNFGEDVANIVSGVTKVSNLRLRGSNDEIFVENLRKMFLSMAKDLRVVIVKLADRLHNMQTLYAVPLAKQKRIAQETLEIFAPLAERLSMGQVKGELEDLAFPYVYPEDYDRVKKLSENQYKKAKQIIKKMKRALLTALAKEKIRPKIQTREKNIYSLWRKLTRPDINWDFTKIHDIVALRIIVDDVKECYTALGVVHASYKPVPYLGVSDFIAQPKPNGYQSIHTKVIGPDEKIVEVQIRTHKMHEQAEYGIAAHWHLSMIKSKSGITSEDIEEGKQNIVKGNKFKWVNQLAQWQKDIKDSKEFLEAVKFDALNNRNFAFSPHGDVYDLPVGATPVDFAYAVHTDLGSHIQSAIINGKIVPLDYKIKSGDVVKIIKTKNKRKPTRDWLNFVKTTTAKREINKELRK